MRKLSFKWPIWLTAFAFVSPAFYVWFAIRYGTFNNEKLLERLLGGIGVAIMVWLAYGTACLFARPLGDTSAEEPSTPHPTVHIDLCKREDSEGPSTP